MNAKVVSDGTPAGTKLFDRNCNEVALDIRSIAWHQGPRDLAEVTVTLLCVDLDVRTFQDLPD